MHKKQPHSDSLSPSLKINKVFKKKKRKQRIQAHHGDTPGFVSYYGNKASIKSELSFSPLEFVKKKKNKTKTPPVKLNKANHNKR